MAEENPPIAARDVVLTSGRPNDGRDFSADAVAFAVDGTSGSPLRLADALPCRDTRVWAVGEEVTSQDPRQRLFAGTVRRATSRFIEVKFDGTPNFIAFSGAPVVDASGRVVGTLLAGGVDGVMLMPAMNLTAMLNAKKP